MEEQSKGWIRVSVALFVSKIQIKGPQLAVRLIDKGDLSVKRKTFRVPSADSRGKFKQDKEHIRYLRLEFRLASQTVYSITSNYNSVSVKNR